MSRRLLVSLLTVSILATGAIAAAQEVGPSVKTTVQGRRLQPIGDLVGLGNFPIGGAVTPDGRFLWTASSGRGKMTSAPRRQSACQAVTVPPPATKSS